MEIAPPLLTLMIVPGLLVPASQRNSLVIRNVPLTFTSSLVVSMSFDYTSINPTHEVMLKIFGVIVPDWSYFSPNAGIINKNVDATKL